MNKTSYVADINFRTQNKLNLKLENKRNAKAKLQIKIDKNTIYYNYYDRTPPY